MDKETRNHIQRATQAARGLLEREYREQLEGTFDILLDGTIAEQPGSHLSDRQEIIREKLIAAIAHKRSSGLDAKEAVDAYLREAAFTTLNRFVALKMLEARNLVQECVSKGEDSSGFKEFSALAPGLVTVEYKGYRLYIETIFDEIGQEVRVLFDRHDVASLLWPDRQTLLELLGILNAPELVSVWAEDETIGWVYQYFNGDDERTKMRAESQAPRNSRELAVRNQFFTPRYVVQFLTDNTLGRTWFEMMQGDTKLADLEYLVRRPNEVFLTEGETAPESEDDESELSQEELLQQTVYVPFRAKKDPRDLRILDPACGSGHFLLYTFDLLITIYDEAWADAGASTFTKTGTQLRVDYNSIEDVRRAMPELILRHNLHGVDIDPRAAQIAALALWMRAQGAYNQFEVDRADRPSITKTNVVVAEPMPGDSELVEEFAASLRPAVLGDLFKKMVEEMKLAGELGSLLKIDESIADAVKEAEEEHRQGNLFAKKIESQDFWDTADEAIIAALRSFAESALGTDGVRRQLFAGDAAQGVAFIELMRKRFDSVLMNPPFGACSLKGKSFIQRKWPTSKHDIYAVFVERGIELVSDGAFVGALTSRTGFFLKTYQAWREETVLPNAPPYVFADLGGGVLDAALVETAAYCLAKTVPEGLHASARSEFYSLLDHENKGELLQRAIRGASTESTYCLRCSELSLIPGSPFCYWVDVGVRRVFASSEPTKASGRDARFGASPKDRFRFVRLTWEVPVVALGNVSGSDSPGWVFFAKGGEFAEYVADIHLCLRWGGGGRELKAHIADYRGSRGWGYNWTAALNGYSEYGRPGLTWTLRTSSSVSFRALPQGCIFADKGPALFVDEDSEDALLATLSLLNSSSYKMLVDCVVAAGDAAARSYEVGLIQRTPFPRLPTTTRDELAALGRQAWTRAIGTQTSDEVSKHFVAPALLQVSGSDLFKRRQHWGNFVSEAGGELRRLQRQIDQICASLYQLQNDSSTDSSQDHVVADRDILPGGSSAESREELVSELLSWSVGVAFGRFDVRTASRLTPSWHNPDPFDPLPVCSPGMLKGDDGLPLVAAPTDSCLSFLMDENLVDDRGHAADLIGRSREVFENVFDDPAARWHEASDLVGVRNQGLRAWFAKKFFPYHVKQYSKSRRKAPIYWQLSTSSASYSVWCYYHRMTPETLFRVANDYVTPKVDHEERRLNTLLQETGPDPSSSQRRTIDAQETFVAELRAFEAEVKRIAPLWNPDLNDGVIINFAPLWRLVPQHKAWQKECKKVWGKLVKGDYDWAHLAMHLWPERVVPKCQDDRSLAIAHGIEGDFWYEDDDGKWKKRQASSQRVEELVAERSSTAVKTALQDLLGAPAPAGKARRKRRTK